MIILFPARGLDACAMRRSLIRRLSDRIKVSFFKFEKKDEVAT